MRWELLFADLEAQLESARSVQAQADLAELTRAERATVHLRDRFRGSLGSEVQVLVGDERTEPGVRVVGRLVDAAEQWCLLEGVSGNQQLVPLDAVRAVRGLAAYVAPPAGVVESRLGLGHVLRAVARDRVRVQVLTGAGELAGRVDGVGADHLELVDGAARWIVPFASVLVVRST